MFKYIGSISSGTMRSEDLISEFADVLRNLANDAAPVRFTGEPDPNHVKLCDEADALEDYDSDDAEYILDELMIALNEYAPDYFYFGTHPGDGADYGFWIVDDVAQCVKDDGGLIVSDTSEVPDDYTDIVLDINDHGNTTLYSADNGKLSEIWAVV